jgi:hypothetical protein
MARIAWGCATSRNGRQFFPSLDKPASRRNIGAKRITHPGRQFRNRSRVFHVRRQLDPQPVFQRKHNVSNRELIYVEFSKVSLQVQALHFIADDTHYYVEDESLRELFDHYPAPQPFSGRLKLNDGNEW